jgi:hypothetical protein
MKRRDDETSSERWDRRVARRVTTLAEKIDGFCEARSFVALGIFSALYLAVVGLIAARKQLENDELFTLNIARLPRMTDVWAALMTGAEQLPPFFYLLTRISLSVFGESGFTLRLPAIVGFWAMCLCLFRFVRLRSTAVHGFAAMLFALTTGAYYYAFEARPYGLVLGFTGLALISWQSLADGERRVPLLAGFALSLAAAVSCHYYAVLSLIPFACGEVARTVSRRRVDPGVWTAMLGSLSPLIFFLPLIASARSYSNGFWSQPVWGDIQSFYAFMLEPAVLPLAAFLILASLAAAIFNGKASEDGTGRFGLLPHEIAVAAGFLIIPAFTVILAMLITRAFTNRYALPATVGLCILIALGLHPLLRGRAAPGVILLFCLAGGFAARGIMTGQASEKRAQNREAVVKMLQSGPAGDLPVAISDMHYFLLLSHYAPPEVRSRLVYLADPEASLRRLGHNSLERGMFDLLKPWFKLNVREYRPYVSTGHPFLLCGEPQNFLNWILGDLISSGAHLELVGSHQETLIFLVNRDGKNRPE